MELKDVRRLSMEKGIGQKFICKEERLTRLLTQLYLTFKEEIVLKGGTALNRGFLKDKGRFSEDIDVDIITTNREQMKSYLERKMKTIQGFDVKKPRMMNETLRFDCYYTNEIEQKDRIQVEFYLGHNGLIGETGLYELHSPILEGHNVVFRTYTLESLIARKIVALARREEGKDLYDLFYTLKEKYDKKQVVGTLKELCSFYEVNDIGKEVSERFDKMSQNIKYIGNSTNHYIAKDQALGWTFILEETRRMVMQVLKGVRGPF